MRIILLQGFFFLAYAVLNTAAMVQIKEVGGTFGVKHHAATFGRLALLRRDDASSVFPIAIGATVLATNVVGVHRYGETITGRKIAGTLVLVAGIVLMFLDVGRP